MNESSYSSLINGMLDSYDVSFQKEISFFYDKLAASQQLLGVEFENVLFNNLWALYED